MDYDKLYELVRSTEVKNGTIVRYHDVEFKIGIREFIKSTASGYFVDNGHSGILISKEVPSDERKLCLLHEIVELCLIRFYGFRPFYEDSRAHDIALKHEELYKKWLAEKEIYLGWADERDVGQ